MINEETKKKARARLRRANGQVEGVIKMVEDDRYCVDILMQLAAARVALGKVATLLLDNHVRGCVSHAFESDDEAERERITRELLNVFDRYLAS